MFQKKLYRCWGLYQANNVRVFLVEHKEKHVVENLCKQLNDELDKKYENVNMKITKERYFVQPDTVEVLEE